MAAEFLKPQILAFTSSLMLVGGLCSLRSPLMPLFGVVGTAASAFYLISNPAPTRRQRELAVRLTDIKKRELILEEEKRNVKSQFDEYFKQIEIQANEFVETQLKEGCSQIASAKDYLNQKEIELSDRENRLKQKIQKLQQEFAQQEKHYQEWAERTAAEFNAKLEEAEKLINSADARAEKYYSDFYGRVAGKYVKENAFLKEPEFTPGSTKDELLADKVIGCLRKFGVIVKEPVVKVDKRGFVLEFKVLPLRIIPEEYQSPQQNQTQISSDPISAGKAVMLVERYCLPDIMAAVPGCKTTPKIEPIYGGVRLTVDTSGVNWEKEQLETNNKIYEPPKGHIFKIFKKSYHLGFEGSTGRGKTTWTRNCLGAMIQELGGENIEIRVSAGKPDLALKEFDACVGLRAGLLLLKEAGDLVAKRLEIHEGDYLAGRELTVWDKKIIFFFDEITDLARYWNKIADPEEIEFLFENGFPFDEKGKPLKNLVGVLLQRCWILGRSLGIMILISGQNLNASTLGVQVSDLLNMGMIYLGTAARKGIAVRGLPTKEEQHYLNSQYALRINVGQEFFGLFCDAVGEVWLSALPAPGEYEVSLSQNSVTIAEKGLEVDSNGLKNLTVDELPENSSSQPFEPTDLEQFKLMLEKSYGVSGTENSTSPTSLKRQWSKDVVAKELVSDWRDEIIDLVNRGIKEPSLIIYKLWSKKPAKGLYIKVKNEIELLLKHLK